MGGCKINNTDAPTPEAGAEGGNPQPVGVTSLFGGKGKRRSRRMRTRHSKSRRRQKSSRRSKSRRRQKSSRRSKSRRRSRRR